MLNVTELLGQSEDQAISWIVLEALTSLQSPKSSNRFPIEWLFANRSLAECKNLGPGGGLGFLELVEYYCEGEWFTTIPDDPILTQAWLCYLLNEAKAWQADWAGRASDLDPVVAAAQGYEA